MKTGNTIPDVIFHWLESKPFKMLAPSEKEAVNAFLTPEEYDDMHVALHVMSQNKDEQRKGLVMEAFDRQHGLTVRHLSVGWVWKAAAVILPAGIIAGLYFLKHGETLEGLAQRSPVDTVYVEKEVVGPTEIIHDTIYYLGSRKSQLTKYQRAQKIRQADVASGDEDMHGLSLEEVRALSAEQKGSSLEEDTTWMSFETVPL